jgi:hypothetical protein
MVNNIKKNINIRTEIRDIKDYYQARDSGIHL